MSTQTPKLKVDNAQNVLKENNFQKVVIERFCVLGHILFFLVKLLYYWGEVIYLKFNPPPPTPVEGLIVLITGTGHGIGRELALAYSSRGAIVVGWDINKKNNDETIKEIAEMDGRPKAYSFQCDVTNREEVLKTAKDVQSLVGDVDILINNAGIMPCHPIGDHTPQEIEKIIAVNLTAHFWLLEAFLPSMKRKNQGHIVSLSSMAGYIGFSNLIPYCASKFGVRGYMEALHEELRLTNPQNKIKLTVIFPYMVDTGLCKRPRIKYETLMPLLSPKDVAEEILDAQTKAKIEVTIPSYLGGLTLMGRCLPYKAAIHLKDTFEAFVESDL
ncbi:short-chain dehydrogenase/reductase family 16C member 6-like [Euwallacea fornicatus]|uniref:short-chain dehydrogenase/reductase family 16C member 6-like n=1 Tax=Euwallacea fornicatus TaxID=995702 RepID=UPI0033902298